MIALKDAAARPTKAPALPVIETGTARDLAEGAWWDLTEGLRLWKMWTQQSRNDVRRRYKRTLLGPAWVTVSLLVFAGALSVVWAGLWKLSATEFLPFLLSGLLPWTLISSAIGEGCGVFLSGEGLIKSRQFPYSVLLYASLARHVVVFGHNLIAYFIIALACGVSITWATPLLLPGLILAVLNSAWMALVVAIFCLRFRDCPQIVASLLQIAVFITPIFWAAGQLQGTRALLVDVNLLHHMVDVVRQPLLGKSPALVSYAVCAGGAVSGGLLAYRLFTSKRHRLAYWF